MDPTEGAEMVVTADEIVVGDQGSRCSTVGYGEVVTAPSMQHQARRAANSDWANRLARLGFCARGLVYVIVGVIALHIAWGGPAASDASKQGALKEIAERPFGILLLVVLAVGLAGYAVWRLSEALWGKQDEEDEHKRTIKRLGSAAKAVLYGALCFSAVRLVMAGRSGAGGREQERALTARALELSGGRYLVGAVGLALIAAGGYVAYRGLAQRFAKRLDTWDMGPVEEPIIDVLGTVGLAARGLLFSVAGFLVVRAAIDFDPQEAQGLDGTLRMIARQAFGQMLLTVTAIGLIAYGLFSFAEARYRQL